MNYTLVFNSPNAPAGRRSWRASSSIIANGKVRAGFGGGYDQACAATPHLVPMAQDFKGAFYPSRDDKAISTLEFICVELAAIQGLNQKLVEEATEKDARISELKKNFPN